MLFVYIVMYGLHRKNCNDYVIDSLESFSSYVDTRL